MYIISIVFLFNGFSAVLPFAERAQFSIHAFVVYLSFGIRYYFLFFFTSPPINILYTQVILHQIQYCWCTTVWCTVHKMIANELASQHLITFGSHRVWLWQWQCGMEMNMEMETRSGVNSWQYTYNSHKWITELKMTIWDIIQYPTYFNRANLFLDLILFWRFYLAKELPFFFLYDT